MILTCPSCAARFLVNSAAIGAEGREVRCGRCSNSWFAAPESEAEAATAAEAPLVAPPLVAPPPIESPLIESPLIESGPSSPLDRPLRPETPRSPANLPANLPAIRRRPRRWPARLAWMTLIAALTAALIGIGTAVWVLIATG